MNAELSQVAKLALIDNSLLPIFGHLPPPTKIQLKRCTLNGTIFNKLFKNVMNIARLQNLGFRVRFRVLGFCTLFHLIFVRSENEHRQNEVKSLCLGEG